MTEARSFHPLLPALSAKAIDPSVDPDGARGYPVRMVMSAGCPVLEHGLAHVGAGNNPVLLIDGATGDPAAIVGLAAALGPFPTARGNSYPGLRRHITPRDAAAADYAARLLRAIAGPLNAAFGIDGFDLLDASFSIVTAPPATLSPQQRAPHFDSTDPDYLAVMHYLGGAADGGTAFYRQRATGIERVSDASLPAFVAAARSEAAGWHGYIDGTNASFERIGTVAGVADRVVAYHGALLHSGSIPADATLDPDPRRGRLTANFFVRGRRPIRR